MLRRGLDGGGGDGGAWPCTRPDVDRWWWYVNDGEGEDALSERAPRSGECSREEDVVPDADDMRMGLCQQLTEVGRPVTARSACSDG